MRLPLKPLLNLEKWIGEVILAAYGEGATHEDALNALSSCARIVQFNMKWGVNPQELAAMQKEKNG
jgi:hypothetical protein